jgi:SAM-dependent methyltransferase
LKYSSCRCCKNTQLTRLIDFGLHPVVHDLLVKPNEEFETYPFVLATCDVCGLIQLEKSFPQEIFYKNYFTLSSWKLQPHARYLIEVIEKLSGPLRGKRIMEIGCNDGSFLDLVADVIGDRKTSSSIVAFEPSEDAYEVALSKGYNVHNEFFGEAVVDKHDLVEEFDLIVSRQVFEHIDNPSDFLCGVSLALKKQGILVLEVPNFQQNLDNFDYTLWEEHVTYFTLTSLKECLRRNGFHIFHYEVTLFAGSALTVFAQKAYSDDTVQDMPENTYAVERELINRYAKSYPLFKQLFFEFLRERTISEVFIYGCGARSCFFANNFLTDMSIQFIDDRIEKVGKFVPKCMGSIVSWDEQFKSSYILLGVNSEVEHALINKRRLISDHFCSILPPSVHLPHFWKNFKGLL